MAIEDLFYDYIPEDGKWHRMELNVIIEEGLIKIDGTTHRIIVDDKRVD